MSWLSTYILDHAEKSFLIENNNLKQVEYEEFIIEKDNGDYYDSYRIYESETKTDRTSDLNKKYENKEKYKGFIISFYNEQFLDNNEKYEKINAFIDDLKNLKVTHKMIDKKMLKTGIKTYERTRESTLDGSLLALHTNTKNAHIHLMIDLKQHWGKNYYSLKKELNLLCEKYDLISTDNTFSQYRNDKDYKEYKEIESSLKKFSWSLTKKDPTTEEQKQKLIKSLSEKRTRSGKPKTVFLTNIEEQLQKYINLGGSTSHSINIKEQLQNKLNVNIILDFSTRKEDTNADVIYKEGTMIDVVDNVYYTACRSAVIPFIYKEEVRELKEKSEQGRISFSEKKYLESLVWIFRNRRIVMSENGKYTISQKFSEKNYLQMRANLEADLLLSENYTSESEMIEVGFHRKSIKNEHGKSETKWYIEGFDVTETIKNHVGKNGLFGYFCKNSYEKIQKEANLLQYQFSDNMNEELKVTLLEKVFHNNGIETRTKTDNYSSIFVNTVQELYNQKKIDYDIASLIMSKYSETKKAKIKLQGYTKDEVTTKKVFINSEEELELMKRIDLVALAEKEGFRINKNKTSPNWLRLDRNGEKIMIFRGSEGYYLYKDFGNDKVGTVIDFVQNIVLNSSSNLGEVRKYIRLNMNVQRIETKEINIVLSSEEKSKIEIARWLYEEISLVEKDSDYMRYRGLQGSYKVLNGNYVVFPMKDDTGVFCGITGYKQKEYEQGKIINTGKKNYGKKGFVIFGNTKAPKEIILVESVIDGLSHQKLYADEIKDALYISFEGSHSRVKLKKLLEKKISEYNIESVVCAFDNDIQGNLFDIEILDSIGKEKIKIERPLDGKDWNELLVIQLRKENNLEEILRKSIELSEVPYLQDQYEYNDRQKNEI